MMRGTTIKRLSYLLTAVILVLVLAPYQSIVQAAAVTSASDVLSTIKQSVVANHTITFTLNGSDTFSSTETVTVTFPTGFDLTALASPGDYDFRNASTDETIQSGACGATDTIRAVVAAQVITFTACNSYTAESAGSTIIIKIGTHAAIGATGANQITNQSAAQNTSDPKILIGGTDASGTIAVEIVTNNELAVTATVDPALTCAVDGNVAAFGTFVTGTIDTASQTPIWTITTNATTGYSLSVRSAGNATNAGLYSAAASYVIKSADASENSTADLSVAATIGYGLQATKTNGDAGSATSTISAPYTSTSDTVGRLQLTAQTVSSAAGPVSNATITSTLKAKVTGLVPPGSYVDTLTYVCSGIY